MKKQKPKPLRANIYMTAETRRIANALSERLTESGYRVSMSRVIAMALHQMAKREGVK